jgi:2'-5' RNA ligase
MLFLFIIFWWCFFISAQQFMLNFNQLAFWHKPRILCLLSQTIEPQLLSLVDALTQVAEQCAIKVEDRPYQPHITLARKAQELINTNVLGIEWYAITTNMSRKSSSRQFYGVLSK